ncbi:hypothetical protein NDU88_006752 [Pleurodeles waltl]|uniref:Uncharacterized protein n=1 Tax=Pleurodeles waltl TaxID=8319 RepID=A0AAV7WF43_PLEWA|nr:hypothetical protein NDU88_006752 [Pleurodeles waltl]
MYRLPFTQHTGVERFKEVTLLTDHSPVGTIKYAGLPPRIDPWYLKEGDFPNEVRKGTKRYFDDNLGSVTSAGILWEAFESIIRGQAQALIGLKKERRLQCETIEGEVSKLAAGGPMQLHHCHSLLLKQQELRDLEDDTMQRTKQNRLLAWLEKRDQGRIWMMEIRDEAGGRCTTGDDIAEAFATYYEHVYSAKTDQPYENCMELLGGLLMTELRADDRWCLTRI